MYVKDFCLSDAVCFASEIEYDQLLQQVGKKQYDLDWSELAAKGVIKTLHAQTI